MEFIAEKLKEREIHRVNMKKLEVTAVPELARLFKHSSIKSRMFYLLTCSDENGKFYQYIRSERKRTYKQIEDDNELKDRKIDELIKAKADLERLMGSMENEIEFYRHTDLNWEENKDQNKDIRDQHDDFRDPNDMN